METTDHENIFLYQLFLVQNNFQHGLNETLQNIFNLYDFDGDGILDYDDYVGFIGDLMYVSTLMHRIPDNQYTLDNVLRFAKWSSSNFPSSLFREPLQKISYEVFIDGIMHALTETKEMPIVSSKMYFTSLVPELLNYFNYYIQIATRRGWPTFTNTDMNTIHEAHESWSTHTMEPPKPSLTVEEQLEEDLKEYRERHQRKRQEQKEEEEKRIKEQQRQEIQRRIEQQLQIQQQIQRQIQENLRNRVRELNGGTFTVDQFQEHVPPPRIYTIDHHEDIITIKKEEVGFEPIEGDINVIDFVNANKETNIAFKVGERYYLVDRSRFHAMMSFGEKDNAIFYGCSCEIDADWTNPQTWNVLQHVVLVHPIYVNVQQIGLPIRYLLLDNVRAITESKHNFFIIEKPTEEENSYIPSFASDNVLNHGIGSISALHCQSGQGDTIYKVRSFTVEIV